MAPYGPQWLSSDYPEDIPVTWEEQTQTGQALRFGSGLRGRRSAYGTGALAVLVMAVILVIIALDSPQEQSFIRVSQTSLIQLRDSLQAETNTTALPQPAPTLRRDTQ